MRLRQEAWCQIQAVFLVSAHLCFLAVLDEYFLAYTRGLCCCPGKTLERKEFQHRAHWPYCPELFLWLLVLVSFFFFLVAHERKKCFWQRETDKILRGMSPIWTFLNSQEQRGLRAARLRGPNTTWPEKQKGLRSHTAPRQQASPSTAATVLWENSRKLKVPWEIPGLVSC